MFEIKRLPSGFYSIWAAGEWLDASSKSEADAIAWIEEFFPGSSYKVVSA